MLLPKLTKLELHIMETFWSRGACSVLCSIEPGSKDRYDFTLDYEVNAEAPGPFTAATGPGLFRAFQEQAGLRLEATKGPVEILVIDHAEKPSAN
jgi:hypothetical protein